MKKFLFLLIMMLPLAMSLKAQDTTAVKADKGEPAAYRHNLQFDLGGGLESLRYSPLDGKWIAGPGAKFDINYQYMFTRNWGIGAGLGVSLLQQGAKYDFSSQELGLIHPDNGREYRSDVTFSDWKEMQRLLTFDIPLRALYQQPLTDKWELQFALGLTLNIALWNDYRATSGTYTVTGYFPSTNVTYSDLPNHGFGTYQAADEKGKNMLAPCGLTGNLEAGALYSLTDRAALYFGLYAGYGFVNMAKGSSQALYAGGEVQDYAGVLQTNQVREAHPVELGVRVGLRFGLKDRIQRVVPCETLAPEEVHDTIVKTVVRTIHDTITISRVDTVTITHEMIVAKQDSILHEILLAAHYQSKSYVTTFDENSEELFAELKQAMEEHPDNVILITGHTDATGPADENMVLGQQRADAFKDALVRQGIEAKRIITFSRGEEEPVAPNNTPEGRAANRRVELKMK